MYMFIYTISVTTAILCKNKLGECRFLQRDEDERCVSARRNKVSLFNSARNGENAGQLVWQSSTNSRVVGLIPASPRSQATYLSTSISPRVLIKYQSIISLS